MLELDAGQKQTFPIHIFGDTGDHELESQEVKCELVPIHEPDRELVKFQGWTTPRITSPLSQKPARDLEPEVAQLQFGSAYSGEALEIGVIIGLSLIHI